MKRVSSSLGVNRLIAARKWKLGKSRTYAPPRPWKLQQQSCYYSATCAYFLYITVHYTYGLLYHVHTNWSYPPWLTLVVLKQRMGNYGYCMLNALLFLEDNMSTCFILACIFADPCSSLVSHMQCSLASSPTPLSSHAQLTRTSLSPYPRRLSPQNLPTFSCCPWSSHSKK